MSLERSLLDQADRDRIRHDLDHTIVVEAAAGTGKTTELVQRILRVLSTGRARIEQIVAVTFTEKAAGELKLRLRKELESLRQRTTDATSLAHVTDAIQRLEEAHVSTIHGFCADLLRERPVEAAIDPVFDVLTEPRAERLFDEAFHSWLHRTLEDPPEGVRRALRRSVWSRDGRGNDDGPVARVRYAARELAEWRDFTGAWRRDPFDRDAELATVVERLHDLAAIAATPVSRRDPLYMDTAAARDLSRDLHSAERFQAIDPDAIEARLVDLAGHRDFRRARKGRDRMYSATVTRDDVWGRYETFCDALDAFQRAADADLVVLLHDELREVVDGYQTLKHRAGALDFVDLLLCARDLLVRHQPVREAFQARFACLFVDEFQDTDPLQAEILLLLSADDPRESNWRRVTPVPGKLFIVGDPKQAIYRFRRADVETYREVCELLESRGATRAFLRTSFRSTPAIQRVVNAAFEPVMTGDRQTLQAQYVALSPHRDEPAGQPSVVALPVPEPYGKRHVAGYAIDASLPDAVGAFVAWLIDESGWTVSRRVGPNALPIEEPITARDICILFRRFLHFGQDVTRAYVDALEARGIPHLLVGGKSFHGREEVETVRAALAAVEWPDDELSVFATLRGALFAIDDETLLAYRSAHRSFHPFSVPGTVSPDLKPVADALHLLRRLHGRRNYRPVADTVTDLLNATRAHVGFVLRPAGEQALANVLHIAELARQYENQRRHVVPRVRRGAARSGRWWPGGRSADPRRGERRRPPDDRAQGQRARVPCGDPRRHHGEAAERESRSADRQGAERLLSAARALDANRAGGQRADGSAARRSRRGPRGVRGRDPRARPAGDSCCWRHRVRRRLGQPAQSRDLSAHVRAAIAGHRSVPSAVQEGFSFQTAGRRAVHAGDGATWRPSIRCRARSVRGRLVGSTCADVGAAIVVRDQARVVDREGCAADDRRRRDAGSTAVGSRRTTKR
ncbi:MAG: UvrD-helicase domain-containing protein [Vicinamibacterales bacterium]